MERPQEHCDAAVEYRTYSWNGKFLYGAYTTLVSSWTLFKNQYTIRLLQEPIKNREALDVLLPELTRQYENYDYARIMAIKESALKNTGTQSIFEECRDFCRTDNQNAAFITAMVKSQNLKPVDNYYDIVERHLLQFNVHRGLYHSAYGIPQNSVAAVFNAYLAGIRSVEFDVLESRDFKNIVIHDLVTNRLDGAFDDPPRYVSKWNADVVEKTAVGILNPLADVPTLFPTEVQKLIPTRELLWAVRRWMPEMTLYADARNSAPISLLKLLYDEPELKKDLVIKIYPFELAGGAYDTVMEYADRYTGKDTAEAIRQLQSVNANLLLAMGGLPIEVSERVSLSSTINAASTLRWNTETITGARLTTLLPFSTDSMKKPVKWSDYNYPWGLTLFSYIELEEIQARTFLFHRWALDFSSIGNVRVFQLGLTPSLVQLIDADDRQAFDKIPTGQRFNAAVFDNFMETFYCAMREDFFVNVVDPTGSVSIKSLWHRVSFGASDRYPDFSLAERNADGSVNQETLQDFYYSMTGSVYQKNDYDAKSMRSTEAMCNAILTWPHQGGIPGDRGGYLTTDLPVDLRTLEMGLSASLGFPQWMHYRVGAMIKEGLTPEGKFTPKTWSTQLFGKIRREHSNFGQDYDLIGSAISRRKTPALAIDSLHAFNTVADVLVNKRALAVLGESGNRIRPLTETEFITAIDILKSEFHPIDDEVLLLQRDFAAAYGVNYDGTPSDKPLQEVLLVPEANWDH